VKDEDKKRFLAQLMHLDANYSGGLPEYIRNAKKLLRDAQDGETPLLLNPLYGGQTPYMEGNPLYGGQNTFQD